MSFTTIRRLLTLSLVLLIAWPIFGAAQTKLTVPVPGSSTEAAETVSDANEPAVAAPSPTPAGIGQSPKPSPASARSAQAASAPTPTPLVETSEFQDFVTASLGKQLPIYGMSLFEGVPTTFAPVDRIPVTADYVIGPGDELLIRAWGQIDLDSRIVVDRDGQISIPQVGTLTVAGLKYQQLSDALKTAIGRVFRNFDLSVTMGQLRSIQVFVVGQARRPGAYTVSSLSTLVSALFASGGPSVSGSMRHIQLRRDDKVVAHFDLYDLLLKGDKSKDAKLLPGDVIYIPPVGPLVALAGSVNVPAVYELKGSETLGEALQLAGGLTNVATGLTASIERVYDRATRRVDQFPLDPAGMARSLQDADLVRVYAISPKFENAVTLRGNVAIPGRYPWHQGMRVRDVIPTRETLITRDYWLQQNLAATNKDIGGLPEVNWDYALITRMGPDDLSNHLLPFNLGKAIEDAASSDNLELQPGDIITIFSQADVRAPERQRPIVVYLEGEVRTPGVYRVEPGESLRDLVARVGGFTPQAYLFGSEFTRESTRLEQQARLEEMAQQIQRDAQRNATLLAAKAGDNTGLAAKLQLQQSMVNTMKPLKATGRMVLNLRPSASTVDALPKLVLEDGDHFYVPSRSSSLSVFGEVVTPSTFVFEPRKRIRDYLRDAGGMTRLADGSRTYVLRANGSTVSVRSSADLWNGRTDDLKLMPGDAIVVSQRLPQIGIMSGVRDWAQLLSQFGLTAAAINVLR